MVGGITKVTEQDLIAASERSSPLSVGITAFGSWMLGVGSIIGSMAWLIHGPMLARAGVLPTLASWVVAALMNLPLALILAELSSMFPNAGGPYVYKYVALKRLFPAYGQFLGFATGWLYWIAMLTGLACMANGFAALVSHSIYVGTESIPIWFGPAAIVMLFGSTTVMNLTRIKQASKLNNVFTFLKLLLAAAFIGLVVTAKTASVGNLLGQSQALSLPDFISRTMGVLILSITAFSGIEIVGCTASETENPTRSVPRAIILTLGTVALIYIAMAVAVGAASPYVTSADGTTMVVPGTLIQATCPALAGFLGGAVWGQIFTWGVVGSIITCSFNSLLALARISYSMSVTKLFPARFSHVDEKDACPKDGLWFQFWCLCAISIAANVIARFVHGFDPYTFLGEVFGFLYSFLAVLYGFCLISLRYTDPERPRPFRLGKGNALAWVMAILAAAVYGFVALACASTTHQITACILLLCGLPIYFIYRTPAKSPTQ